MEIHFPFLYYMITERQWSAKHKAIRIMIIKTGGMENEYIRGQWFEKGLHDEIWRQ